jgi:hypothetical protein
MLKEHILQQIIGLGYILKQYFVGSQYHNSTETEISVQETLQMQEPNFYCHRSSTLVSKWDKCIDVPWDYAEK